MRSADYRVTGDGVGAIEFDLCDIKNWADIGKIEGANVSGVQNPAEGFLEWSQENGAVS